MSIDADETRVAQVMGNLLHNAAKFTPRGGSATVSLRASGGAAELRVPDTGAGIDPRFSEPRFEPFTPGQQTLARTEGGLGLALVGHDVDVAFDGPSAVERARATGPDFVLCDLGLPGMSGYEVAQALRSGGVGPIQLVAVSGDAQPEDVSEAREAGYSMRTAPSHPIPRT